MSAQDVQARVQDAVTKMLQDLDISCVRETQGDMHRCAAKCCDNKTSSMEEVHECIQKCSTNIVSVQNFIQTELGNYQDRIQRCALNCKDQVADKITSETTDAEATAYKAQFEACVNDCADTHIKLIPSMLKRMKYQIQSKSS